jgi:hypothetical protein
MQMFAATTASYDAFIGVMVLANALLVLNDESVDG